MKRGATNVLDQYDLEVLRTWKVRGAILCETNTGLYILKEFNGRGEKLPIQNLLLTKVREQGFEQVEMLLPNKEGAFVTMEADGTKYSVKTYIEGQECNVEKIENCKKAMESLAFYHVAASKITEPSMEIDGVTLQTGAIETEFEKHNRELKKVRRFLKEKGQKSEFEHFLLRQYDTFLEQALQITALINNENTSIREVIPCHGDFQYHNILFQEEIPFFINFEKCILDDVTRDICYFMRKVLEKHDWSVEVGNELLSSYSKVKPISDIVLRRIYYRFSYPEKFWKIVNFYYNSGKAFIPGRNAEKLDIILNQEKQKHEFIKVVLYG